MKKDDYDWRTNLKQLIEQRGMSARSFSLLLGFSDSYISNYTLKRREAISDKNFKTIAKGLNMHPAELRYGVDFSIDISLYDECRKAVLKAAKTKNQNLSEAQKRRMTANLYNKSISTKTISYSETKGILDNID